VGPLKHFVQQVQAQRSFAGAVEMWDEQKWVQQMRSAPLAPDAERQDLARRNLVGEMPKKRHLQEGLGAISP
jgi:hypothetical protein